MSDCTFCQLNLEAADARHTHGLGSPEHRAALARITPAMWEAARAGRAHDETCTANEPLVVLA